MKIDLIIFDLDGTILNSMPQIASTVNSMLSKLSLPKRSKGEIASFVGRGVKQLIRDSLGGNSEKFFNKAYKLYWSDYSRIMVEKGKLFPGVKKILKYFKNKKLAVASNSIESAIKKVLKKQGVDKYFSIILGGKDEACLKPSPCPVNRILKTLKIKRSRALIVGDMDIDIKTGKASGIHTCGVTYGIGKKEDILKAKPDLIIGNIEQLIEKIK